MKLYAADRRTFDSREPADQALEAVAIALIKCLQSIRVDIEYRDHVAVFRQHRHDDLRATSGITGDVAGKGAYVRHYQRPSLRSGSAAYSLTERNLETAERPLIRAYAKQRGL